MRLAELKEKTGLTGERLTFLKCALEGVESDYTPEDLQEAEELKEELTSLTLEEDDQGGW